MRRVLNKGSVVLNKYRVIEIINAGGMSNVYKVVDNSLGKNWCLKEIIKEDSGKNKLEYRSLLQEAMIMKDLNHPSIPRIVTIDETDDSIFIIMDYVDGKSIKELVKEAGTLSQEVVVGWTRQICEVLVYLHSLEKPIFYRDMKPTNVMVQSNGVVRVLDFGISLVLEEGQKIEEPLGSKGYASPEQAKRGSRCDLRSDIYALGMTMYYMMTGIHPKTTKDGLKPLSIATKGKITDGFSNIIYKCIETNPDDRYPSSIDLLNALNSFERVDKLELDKKRQKITIGKTLWVFNVVMVFTSIVLVFFKMYNIAAITGFVGLVSGVLAIIVHRIWGIKYLKQEIGKKEIQSKKTVKVREKKNREKKNKEVKVESGNSGICDIPLDKELISKSTQKEIKVYLLEEKSSLKKVEGSL